MFCPLNRTDLCLWVSFDPKDIITISKGFAPHMVKQETIIWESKHFWYLHQAHISAPLTTKNCRLKIRLVPCENTMLCGSDIGRLQSSIDVVR